MYTERADIVAPSCLCDVCTLPWGEVGAQCLSLWRADSIRGKTWHGLDGREASSSWQ
jgi:hypothetical protein